MSNAADLKEHLQKIGTYGAVVKLALGQGLHEHLGDVQQIQAATQAAFKSRIGLLILLSTDLLFFSG